MIPASVIDLASVAVEKVGLRGIDWAALNKKGRASVWVRDYMDQYMIPAQVQMLATVGTLDLIPGGSPAEYQKNYSISQEMIEDIAGKIMGQGAIAPSVRVTVQLSRESMRYLVSHVYAAASYGALLHYDETIHHYSGVSDAQIATHANAIVGMMNALVLLDKIGLYTALSLKSAQAKASSGLGLAPSVIVALVVTTIAALALLAWVIVNLVDVTKTNNLVASMCTEAQKSGDAATTQQCINTATDKLKAAGTAIPDQAKAALLAVLPYALAGVAVYALFLSAPYLIKAIATRSS